MHLFTLLMAFGCTMCIAHYRGFETRNLIERDEPLNDEDGVELVECPVCDDSGHWMPSNEDCPIIKGNKRYKRCELGTYINEVCGNRRDCYRGPGEQCTVKREIDHFGQKCAPGYYCNKPLGKCQGLGYVIDSRDLLYINPTPYSLNSLKHRIPNGGLVENSYIRRN